MTSPGHSTARVRSASASTRARPTARARVTSPGRGRNCVAEVLDLPATYEQLLRQAARSRNLKGRGSIEGAPEAAGVIGKGLLTDIGAGWQGLIETAKQLRRGASLKEALEGGARGVEGVREHYAPQDISPAAGEKLGKLQSDIEDVENAVNRAGFYDLSVAAPGTAATLYAASNVLGPKKAKPGEIALAKQKALGKEVKKRESALINQPLRELPVEEAIARAEAGQYVVPHIGGGFVGAPRNIQTRRQLTAN